MAVVVTHATVNNAAADPNAEVDSVAWNEEHAVTGLENVDNTSDADKPVSTATQAALDLKADAADPTITGTVSATGRIGVGDNMADFASRWGGTQYPLVYMDRLVNWTPINDNTCVDLTVLQATSHAGLGNQYCSFNVNTIITGGFDWNHLIAFEDQKKHNGSGTLAYDATILSFTSGSGPVTTRYGMWVLDRTGAGTLQNQYGLYVNSLTKGAAKNFGIYTAGATPSYIGGSLLISTTEIAVPTTPKLTLSKNVTAAANAPSTNALLYGYNVDGTSSTIALDAYGTGASAGVVYRSARGTAAVPTNTQNGDFLFSFNVYGYNSTGGFAGGTGFGQGLFAMLATENFTSGGSGTKWAWATNANGGVASSFKMYLGSGLSLNTTTDPGLGCMLATGSILSNGATAGLGYATGAGGAITQITSRTTGVTINKACGAITLFAAAPAVGTWVSFTVTNSAVAATDVPRVAIKSGTNTYIAHVTAVAAGSFQISLTSIVGTASDSPVVNFSIGKAVAA